MSMRRKHPVVCFLPSLRRQEQPAPLPLHLLLFWKGDARPFVSGVVENTCAVQKSTTQLALVGLEGVPRAELAVVEEHPEGSRGHSDECRPALQQHCVFFDLNGDGIIYPWETIEGFQALGFSVLISLLAAWFINGTLSWCTLDVWFPSFRCPIYIKNIHRAKHRSDSGVYDSRGRFVPTKFEEIFSKYDRHNRGGLSFMELWGMTQANYTSTNLIGWVAGMLEWGLTFFLLLDKSGFILKDDVRGVLDGSYFHYRAEVLSRSRSTLE